LLQQYLLGLRIRGWQLQLTYGEEDRDSGVGETDRVVSHDARSVTGLNSK
jgi:hypothetical protein